MENSHRKKKDASRGNVPGSLYESYKNNWLKRTMSATHAPGHELEQTLGDGEGQGGLVCCNPWGHREPDTTGRLNSNNGFGVGNTEFETFVKHGEWCWEAYWTVVLKDLLLQKTDLG